MLILTGYLERKVELWRRQAYPGEMVQGGVGGKTGAAAVAPRPGSRAKTESENSGALA